MERYKLIKDFPENTFKVGTILIKSPENSYFYYRDSKNRFTVYWQAVKDFSEFWEKVVEKNYEILSIRGTSTSRWVYKLTKYPFFQIGCDDNIINIETDPKYYYEIYSVKRLSDGKIFTIGDKVKDRLTDELTNFRTQEIVGFKGNLKIICTAKSGTAMPLSTIRHIEKPLFKTEDNVDIFEDDTYWWVNRISYYYGIFRGSSSSFIEPELYLYFSNKKMALEYIIMNKPCLSLQEVMYSIDEDFSTDSITANSAESTLLNKLKELVKSK